LQLGEPQLELSLEPELLPDTLPEPLPPDPELLPLDSPLPDDPADDPPLPDALAALDDPPLGEKPASTGPTPTAASPPLGLPNTSRLRPPHPTEKTRRAVGSALPRFIALLGPVIEAYLSGRTRATTSQRNAKTIEADHRAVGRWRRCDNRSRFGCYHSFMGANRIVAPLVACAVGFVVARAAAASPSYPLWLLELIAAYTLAPAGERPEEVREAKYRGEPGYCVLGQRGAAGWFVDAHGERTDLSAQNPDGPPSDFCTRAPGPLVWRASAWRASGAGGTPAAVLGDPRFVNMPALREYARLEQASGVPWSASWTIGIGAVTTHRMRPEGPVRWLERRADSLPTFPAPGPTLEGALHFLERYRHLFGIEDPQRDLLLASNDLPHVQPEVRTRIVAFDEIVDDLPTAPRIMLIFDDGGRVQRVRSNYLPGLRDAESRVRVEAERAHRGCRIVSIRGLGWSLSGATYEVTFEGPVPASVVSWGAPTRYLYDVEGRTGAISEHLRDRERQPQRLALRRDKPRHADDARACCIRVDRRRRGLRDSQLRTPRGSGQHPEGVPGLSGRARAGALLDLGHRRAVRVLGKRRERRAAHAAFG
jgi:hypothetical protein